MTTESNNKKKQVQKKINKNKGLSSKKDKNIKNNIDLDLEVALPFLLARAGMKMGLSFTREIKPYDLTLIEWRVCAALHHEPKQRLADVAYHTSSDPSTLSRTVDGLIKRGFVVRERSNEDARALELSLTPEGRVMAERIIPLAQIYEKVALAGFTSEEADLLKSMLKKIYDNMSNLD